MTKTKISLANKDKARAKQIISLLPDYSTLVPLQRLLKEQGCAFTGTWGSIYEQRILPALEDGDISIGDLEELLFEAEEHGMQHVFLYSCTKELARKLVGSDKAIKTGLAKIGLENQLNKPAKSLSPRSLTATDVRIDAGSDEQILVIKLVEVETIEKRGKSERVGDQIVIPVLKEDTRVVSVFRLSTSGDLEIRIAAKSGSRRYATLLSKIGKKLKDYIDIDDFLPTSLTTAKFNLIKLAVAKKGNGVTLKKMKIADNRAQANVSPITDDGGLPQWWVDRLLSDSNATEKCDSCRITLAKDEIKGLPSKDITINLTGAVNEFSILCQCLKNEHALVLRTVLEAG